MAMNLYPELKELVGGVVAMGGAIESGNVTRFAEFNFFADPEAAQSVIDSGIPLSIVTWDATLTVLHTEQELRSLGFESTAAGKLVLEMEKASFAFVRKTYGAQGIFMPDPLAAAYLVDPSIATALITAGLRMELAPAACAARACAGPASLLRSCSKWTRLVSMRYSPG